MTIMQIMKRGILVALSCICVSLSHAQIFSGEYTTEWQWDMKRNTNWMNLLRLHLDIPLWEGRGMLQASTIHIAKTDESVVNDWQIFSNIEEENDFAAIAVLGYMHNWKAGHLFVGVRNANEDFFTSRVTSLFTNSSCGMFPTISASYPIANYPRSGLTVYFDVNLSGWVFRNSITAWHTTAGTPRTTRSSCVRRETAYSTYRSWNTRIRAGVTSPAWLSTRAIILLVRTAPWHRQTHRAGRRVAHGGCMGNRRCGLPATGTSAAWRSIPKTHAGRTAAAATPKRAAPTMTATMSAACQDSMPASTRGRSARWK